MLFRVTRLVSALVLSLLLGAAAPTAARAEQLPCTQCNCSTCTANCLDGYCMHSSSNFGTCFCYQHIEALPVADLIPDTVKAEDAKCAAGVLKLTGKLTTALGKCAAKEIKEAGTLEACGNAANAKYQAGVDKLAASGCDASCSLEFLNTAAFAQNLVAASTQAPRVCDTSCGTVCDTDASISCTSDADCPAGGGAAGVCNVLSCP